MRKQLLSLLLLLLRKRQLLDKSIQLCQILTCHLCRRQQAIPALFIDKKAAEGTLPFLKGIIINLKPVAQGAELMVLIHIKG